MRRFGRLPQWLLGGRREAPLYAAPRDVASLAECHFYHTMELPGWGLVAGDWDLRGGIDELLAGQDFAGRRILEIGPASGYVTFEIERRGGEVVSIEVPDDPGWDFVPHPPSVLAPVRGPRREVMRRLKNSYWLAHRAVGSRARLHYGDAYALPEALGSFDIAIMASVLLHTRAPLAIVEECARRAKTLVIVEMLYPDLEGAPVCRLVPSADNRIWDTWWQFSTDFLRQFLGVLGFAEIARTTHVHQFRGVGPHTLWTLVARREPA